MSTKYQDALVEAKRELYELLIQHERTEKRISKLKLTIAGLKQLCEVEVESTATPSASRSMPVQVADMGLTNMVRSLLRASTTPLSAIDIREKLSSLGFPAESYSSILATLHIILKRLEAKGEIQPIETDQEKEPTAYFYIPTLEQSTSSQRIVRPAIPVASAAHPEKVTPTKRLHYYQQRIKRTGPNKKEGE